MQLSEDRKKEIERRVHRSAAFQRVFSGADGELALKELAIECGANSLLLNDDPRDVQRYDPIRLAYRAKGKDLWTFIQNCLSKDEHEIGKKMLDAENKKE